MRSKFLSIWKCYRVTAVEGGVCEGVNVDVDSS